MKKFVLNFVEEIRKTHSVTIETMLSESELDHILNNEVDGKRKSFDDAIFDISDCFDILGVVVDEEESCGVECDDIMEVKQDEVE